MFLDIGENCSEEKSRSFVFCLSSWMDEKYGRFILVENYLKNGIRVMRLDIYIQDYEKHGISIYAIAVQYEPGVDNSQEIDS
jgi:O-glycosyl hydrolase